MPVGVLLKTEAVGITREVEPVPAPAFAVMRGVEQPIDNALERRARVAVRSRKERRSLLRGRRQADQVVVHAPQQRPIFRPTIRLQLGRLQLGEDKPIDFIFRPLRILDRRRGRFCEWRKRPVLPIAVGDLHFAGRQLGVHQRLVVRRAGIDPRCDLLNHSRRQFLRLGRHERFLRVGNQLQQPAGVGLARHNRRPLAAALQERLACREIEVAARLFAAVTFHAMLLERLAHAVFEQFEASRHLLGVIGCHIGQRLAKRQRQDHGTCGSGKTNRHPRKLPPELGPDNRIPLRSPHDGFKSPHEPFSTLCNPSGRTAGDHRAGQRPSHRDGRAGHLARHCLHPHPQRQVGQGPHPRRQGRRRRQG